MPLHRCCSIDGDADRLVFFTIAQHKGAGGSSGIALLDGDKIATLAAAYIRDLLDRLPKAVSKGVKASCRCEGNAGCNFVGSGVALSA
jgi:phosphoacetylglucosamine mutase